MRAENLENIYLCGNEIGEEGCLALAKANWTKISVIDLGENIFIKQAIKSEKKRVLI
jgi:hypothetical protein